MALCIEAVFRPGAIEISKLTQALMGPAQAHCRDADLKVADFAGFLALRAGDPVIFVKCPSAFRSSFGSAVNLVGAGRGDVSSRERSLGCELRLAAARTGLIYGGVEG
jgi:hypothetical protein